MRSNIFVTEIETQQTSETQQRQQHDALQSLTVPVTWRLISSFARRESNFFHLLYFQKKCTNHMQTQNSKQQSNRSYSEGGKKLPGPTKLKETKKTKPNQSLMLSHTG